MAYIKSPMNYIGNKFGIIDQIEGLFPKDAKKMVDLFCGGCDVTINTDIPIRYANDINYHVVNIFREMQEHSAEDLLRYIDAKIQQWQLSKTNDQGYKDFRKSWNQHRGALDLFVLMCFSFNQQIRFNSAQEYNSPFGKDRSSFSEKMRANLVLMLPKLRDVRFSAQPFQDFDYSVLGAGDFLYADPPYKLTNAVYNDGKRGFTGWGEKEEHDLYEILDALNKRGVRFALSNVTEHKGQENEMLLRWLRTCLHRVNRVK